MTTAASDALRRATDKIESFRQSLSPPVNPAPPIAQPMKRTVVPNALRMTGQ